MASRQHGGLKRFLGRTVAPPRFVGFLVLLPAGTAAYHLLAPAAPLLRALAIGFDLAAAVFLLSLIPFLQDKGADVIRRHADANNANRIVVLAVTTVVSLAILAAIAGELPAARQGDRLAAAQLVGSLILAWLFANSVYALHYAHDFYTAHPDEDRDCAGLTFPGTDEPGYLDFVYFAFTLGMTFQTSDVEITSARLRTVVLLHTFVAFLFNIGVIAFTINALGGS